MTCAKLGEKFANVLDCFVVLFSSVWYLFSALLRLHCVLREVEFRKIYVTRVNLMFDVIFVELELHLSGTCLFFVIL